ncbi:hypothetical protein ACFQ0D_14415, partial [Micromonospora zhanjiangensis]
LAVHGGRAPGWYEPTLAGLGLGVTGLIVAAFCLARHDRLPWIMLGLATVPVLLGLGLTLDTV